MDNPKELLPVTDENGNLIKIDYVKVYNEDIPSSIVLINIDGITSGDLGLYLNTHGICVRSGKHCTKMLKDESGFTDTVRISLYFYNLSL